MKTVKGVVYNDDNEEVGWVNIDHDFMIDGSIEVSNEGNIVFIPGAVFHKFLAEYLQGRKIDVLTFLPKGYSK